MQPQLQKLHHIQLKQSSRHFDQTAVSSLLFGSVSVLLDVEVA